MTGACLSENSSLPATVVQHSSQARPALAWALDACISLSFAWRFCRFMFFERGKGPWGEPARSPPSFPRPSRTARGPARPARSPGAALLTAASAQRGRGAAALAGERLPPACPRLCPQPPGLPLASSRAGSRSRGAGGRRGPARACAGRGPAAVISGGSVRAVACPVPACHQEGMAPGGWPQHSGEQSFCVYFILFFWWEGGLRSGCLFL